MSELMMVLHLVENLPMDDRRDVITASLRILGGVDPEESDFRIGCLRPEIEPLFVLSWSSSRRSALTRALIALFGSESEDYEVIERERARLVRILGTIVARMARRLTSRLGISL